MADETAPGDPLTGELEHLHRIHRKTVLPSGEAVCDSDRHKWRCDADRLLAAVDAVLKLHGSSPYYAGADGCDHPEPPEETDEWEDWEDWADDHPIGTGGDRICLTEHILDFCPECTRVAYGDEEPVNEDCVRAPCGTRAAITRALTGEASDDPSH